MVNVSSVQTTTMFSTSAVPTVPVPFVTAHVSPVGCVATVTAYVAPVASGVEKA